MFQSGAFMNFSFQTVGVGSNDNNNGLLGGIMTPPYGYRSPHKQLREKIRQEKSELQKVESVLKETTRKHQITAKNKLVAEQLEKKKRALKLATLENEYLQEIKRLLAVRAELMRRVREDEAILIILMMKRRRLRAA